MVMPRLAQILHHDDPGKRFSWLAAEELGLDAEKLQELGDRTTSREEKELPDQALDGYTQDHRQEIDGPEDRPPSEPLVQENGEEQTQSELDGGDKETENQRSLEGVDVVTRSDAPEEELLVVVKTDPVDRCATNAGGVGKGKDTCRQRRTQGNQHVQEKSRQEQKQRRHARPTTTKQVVVHA